MPAVMKTETGLVRKQNEDAAWFDENKGIFAVADGMGGHLAGEVASAMAIEKIRKMSEEEKTPSISALRRAILEANQSILDRAYEHDECRGMGTTLSVLWRGGSNLYIAHVGDSRIYRLHGTVLEQVTRDHSLVEEMVRSGILSRSEARVHPRRNIITRALGTEGDNSPDLQVYTEDPADIWLLCSDGLTGMVEDELIRDTLIKCSDIHTAADRLIEQALQAGGHDNITLILYCKEEEQWRRG